MVVDDAMMGVTEVVRGCDLLLSAAQQIYLYGLLGFPVPDFAHLPLICNGEGRRLSKRDASLAMDQLRKKYSASEIIGIVGYLAGLLPVPEPCRPEELAAAFSWERVKVPSDGVIVLDGGI